ncbi:heat shock protein HslJ [Xanthomonas arboricola]|uniref:META domain-containing protein n=1 Tax=Xanthomonas euroxanthea TaxID=2259622 RepID=UPI00141B4D7E|nr:META domain-containing protein [Xanthomonas euroxanthea]NIK40702.1 heat shock protein HslJ [Xanthomonas euroxanthea]
MRAVLFAPALLAAGVTACGSGAAPELPGSGADTAAAESAAVAAAAAANAPLQAALQAQHWQLQQASDAHGTALRSLFVAGTAPLQLDFRDQRIQVSQTCNALGADYSLAQAHLQIGRVVSSKRLCAQPRRMAQERAASELLSGRFAVALNTAQTTPQLTLTRSDGTRLVFDGVATADTRHGGPGQTLLIEVAADTVPCRSDPARHCLQLREQGADGQPATRAWQTFDGSIEGFEHEAGIRTLLRVTRYPAAAGTDAAPVYVLEQMIEASG